MNGGDFFLVWAAIESREKNGFGKLRVIFAAIEKVSEPALLVVELFVQFLAVVEMEQLRECDIAAAFTGAGGHAIRAAKEGQEVGRDAGLRQLNGAKAARIASSAATATARPPSRSVAMSMPADPTGRMYPR